jgi:hypothetical protein
MINENALILRFSAVVDGISKRQSSPFLVEQQG